MDQHVKEFYQSTSEGEPRGGFHQVIPLHDSLLDWNELHKMAPSLPRGWFELAHLKTRDRIDFIKDFWISMIPFQPHFIEFLNQFFTKLDDIGIFLVQKKFDDPFEAHLIYSLKDDGGFFKGMPPADEQALAKLKSSFAEVVFPKDYLCFLQIHDGFSKTTDTGILSSAFLFENAQAFQEMLTSQDAITTGCNDPVDPKKLIPFYESFGMPFFQCFWTEWYPEDEMGNVYYSGLTKTISNVKCRDPMSENMAFPSFTSWLMFYLETFE